MFVYVNSALFPIDLLAQSLFLGSVHADVQTLSSKITPSHI